MAIIEEFTVHGLAGRSRPTHRKLDRHINVFWGLNGTGKTSLLRILSCALRNDVETLKNIPFTSAEVIFWSSSHKARIRRTIERDLILPSDTDDDLEPPLSQLRPVGDGFWMEVGDDDEPAQRLSQWQSELVEGQLIGAPYRTGRRPRSPLESPYKHSYMPISRLTQLASRYAPPRNHVTDSDLDEDFAQQVKQRWQTYNNDALATIRGIQQQGLARILALLFGGSRQVEESGKDRVPGDDAYTLVTDFLEQQGIVLDTGRQSFVSKYDKESALPEVVASIQEVTNEVQQALHPQQQFRAVIEGLYAGNKTLTLDPSMKRPSRGLMVEMDGSTIPLQSLSSGEKQLLRLLLETLAAEDTTVMIDEPELSMHVDWQQVLVASMRRVNPDCQLLLATHSPEVMADIRDEYVFELP